MLKMYQYKVLLDFNGSPFSSPPVPFIPTHTFVVNTEVEIDEKEAIRRALLEIGTYPKSYRAKVERVLNKEDLETKVKEQEEKINSLEYELKETKLKLKLHQLTDTEEIIQAQKELIELYQSKNQ
jgi:hypothetical protein